MECQVAQTVRPGPAPSIGRRGARGRGTTKLCKTRSRGLSQGILFPVVVENPGFGLQAKGRCCSGGAPQTKAGSTKLPRHTQTQLFPRTICRWYYD